MKTNKFLLGLTVSLLASVILAGCGTQAAPEPVATQAPQTQPQSAPTEAPSGAPATTVSFSNDVMPILESRCVTCHGSDRTERGLSLSSYEGVMAGSENGAVIVPGDAANSRLVELVTNQQMPKRGPKLTPPQVQIITDWVAAGAPNN